ncbi:MAG: hypothetical protein L6Q78_13140 [Bacteroidia bacterium]|nr:hypothetical protein [Bacteroidia bacterium]
MNQFRLVSQLPINMEEQLQEFFYFHPSQHVYQSKIRKTIQAYGKPVLVKTGNYISIQVEGKSYKQQSFFLLKSEPDANKLLGVFIFLRMEERLVLAHLAAKFKGEEIELTQVIREILLKTFNKNIPEIVEIAYLSIKIRTKLLLEN